MIELKKVESILRAGKNAIGPEEISNVISSVVEKLNEINQLTEKEFEELESVLSILVETNFHSEFLESIDPQSFFTLGEKLIKLINSKSHATAKNIIHSYLNLFRHSVFLKKIYGAAEWEKLIEELIKQSNFTFTDLWKQRVHDYKSKCLLQLIENGEIIKYSWQECDEIVGQYGDSLYSLVNNFDEAAPQISFLMENSLSMAFLDIACLTTGVINVMIPANSVPEHIEYILNETKTPFIFVSNEKQLSKIKSIKKRLSFLQKAILLEGNSAEEWVISFDQFLSDSNKKNLEIKNQREIKCDDLATIMYTSGTTGEPKGIMFSHMNIVYKRFCRAMALPEIGVNDVFLAYLPLFHTFGRYLELTGAIFWAATYTFMEDPSPQTMIANMKLFHPTIFISIPKKWIQLYEAITAAVDIELADESEIQNVVHNLTGGKLKQGLSAAGFLPPEVFMFFQKYGVELMSGFGMTEATGGITMTPPGKYSTNSLGRALPGISLKLAEDGELLIKGNYVMMGYYGQPIESCFDTDGWFPTGDIMEMDDKGFIEIIDRKKEIYKNIKGETVAPQKIENYFRDFENVKQVFLVGDHRPFNTVLIFPNHELDNSILKKMDDEQITEYFASVIVTVNNFLAPFERIVDFRIINRAFSLDLGELTPKGTYKRRVIEKNFAIEIEQMYKKNHTEVFIDDLEIRIPNWFLREKSSLSSDITADSNKLIFHKINLSLTIKKIDEGKIQIGSFIYEVEKKYIDFQSILTSPEIWIGNFELFEFAGEQLIQWQKNYSSKESIKFISAVDSVKDLAGNHTQLIKLLNSAEYSLNGLHTAVLLLQIDDDNISEDSVKYFTKTLSDENSQLHDLVFEILARPQLSKSLNTHRKMFAIISLNIDPNKFPDLLRQYLRLEKELLNDATIDLIVDSSKRPDKMEAIAKVLHDCLESALSGDLFELQILPSLIKLLASYGIKHPSTYEKIRQILVECQINRSFPEISAIAFDERTRMRNGFRLWLGDNQSVAVDMETGEEYLWEDVLAFEEGLDEGELERIKQALISQPILREAIFLFSAGKIVHLANILPGGVWVSHLRTFHNKSVYRVSVQTRFQGSFELVLNLNKGRNPASIKDEINLLILAGSRKYTQEIVEDFGGYWDMFDIWSGRYIPGDSVDRFLLRESKKNDPMVEKRLYHIWPFFVWNASAAYFNFWRLTNYRYVLTEPSIQNFIIPSHDYQTGTKVVSLSEKVDYSNLYELFTKFISTFIHSSVEQYSYLKRDAIYSFVFAGFINAEGEERGLELLAEYKKKLIEGKSDQLLIKILEEFVETVSEGKFIPKHLYFAIKRFHRWFEINTDADFTAQAQMLNELYDTYQLAELEKNYPESRIQFYAETVFKDSPENFKIIIENIVKKYHNKMITKDEELKTLSAILAEVELSEKEKYFLTRLTFPHLKPSDSAQIQEIKIEGKTSANLVVQYEDSDGDAFYIRKPVSPKEISRLHQLFIEANLSVTFKDEHEYLVAISERGFIIGGLFYHAPSTETAHMEKIVVSTRYRRKGISDRLMNEFCDRMASENRKSVTTGFFRPEYFYKFDFKVEKKYSGLVKKLDQRK